MIILTEIVPYVRISACQIGQKHSLTRKVESLSWGYSHPHFFRRFRFTSHHNPRRKYGSGLAAGGKNSRIAAKSRRSQTDEDKKVRPPFGKIESWRCEQTLGTGKCRTIEGKASVSSADLEQTRGTYMRSVRSYAVERNPPTTLPSNSNASTLYRFILCRLLGRNNLARDDSGEIFMSTTFLIGVPLSLCPTVCVLPCYRPQILVSGSKGRPAAS